MIRATSFVCLAAAIVAGVALVGACGDDSTGQVDAADATASCDCPAAEPPLAGRIARVRADNTLSPGGGGIADAYCPAGAVALGGACEVAVPDLQVVLVSSRFTLGAPPGYRCDWSTATATTPRTGTAEVVCLTPVP